jgi:hypothetical protein
VGGWLVFSCTGGTGIPRRGFSPGCSSTSGGKLFGSHSTAKMAGDEELAPKLVPVNVQTMDDNN